MKNGISGRMAGELEVILGPDSLGGQVINPLLSQVGLSETDPLP
jgi:hypothetical protein